MSGVDQSREMLLQAKAKLPDVELLEGNFSRYTFVVWTKERDGNG